MHPLRRRAHWVVRWTGSVCAIYLHCAYLLFEALNECGEHTQALRLTESLLGRELRVLAEQSANARLPNWQDLVAKDFPA